MSLTLYFHPLASFCWKALIALYENDTPFIPKLVDFGNEESRSEFFAVWPIGKMPALRDRSRGVTVGESSIVVDYLARHYPGRTPLVPADQDHAREARFLDRVFDTYVHENMQKIVLDRLRPQGKGDAFGVEAAREQLVRMYDFFEKALAGKTWATGEDFTLADCSAAPALFYASIVAPFDGRQKNLAAYLDRLTERPSFARVLREAEPYFQFFPMETKPRIPRPSVRPA